MSSKQGHNSWQIANNRPGTAHSFTFDRDRNYSVPAESLSPKGAGKIFNIPQPDYVNVLLQPLASDPPGAEPVVVLAKSDRGSAKALRLYYVYAHTV